MCVYRQTLAEALDKIIRLDFERDSNVELLTMTKEGDTIISETPLLEHASTPGVDRNHSFRAIVRLFLMRAGRGERRKFRSEQTVCSLRDPTIEPEEREAATQLWSR